MAERYCNVSGDHLCFLPPAGADLGLEADAAVSEQPIPIARLNYPLPWPTLVGFGHFPFQPAKVHFMQGRSGWPSLDTDLRGVHRLRGGHRLDRLQ